VLYFYESTVDCFDNWTFLRDGIKFVVENGLSNNIQCDRTKLLFHFYFAIPVCNFIQTCYERAITISE
jgi:hypothetical protein